MPPIDHKQTLGKNTSMAQNIVMDIFSYFRDLASISSPSGQEDEVRKYLERHFMSLGYGSRTDEKGNILFFLDEEGRKLMYCAHMDTVPIAADAHVMEDGKRFFTDRTTALGADDKAAVAVLMKEAERRDSSVLYLFTVSEETGLTGSAAITREFLSPFDIAYAIVPDTGGKVGDVIVSAPGKTRLRLVFKGKAAHAGFAIEKGVNAILLASEFVTQAGSGRLKDGSTVNIATFSSVNSTNVVPAEAVVVLESRSLDEKRLDGIISDLIEKAGKINPDVGILEERLYRPYRHDPDSPVIRFAMSAIPGAGTRSSMGGSDANNLNILGIPALVISCGYENAHSVDEAVEKSEMLELEKVISDISAAFKLANA